MPDFATWALADALTVRQAACLWVGADPSESRFYPTGVLIDQITAVEQMLTAAIRSGVLDADSSANLLASIGNYSTSLVTREALRAFAESKNQWPAFLFDTLLPPKTEHNEDIPVADTETFGSTRSRVGRPLEYDWNEFVVEIIRIANGLDGLPEKQSELIKQMLYWCEDTWGRQPAESNVKTKISYIYNKLGRGQKSRSGDI